MTGRGDDTGQVGREEDTTQATPEGGTGQVEREGAAQPLTPEEGGPAGPETRDAESEREQELSQERIERGGIPLAAERRLRGLREHGGLFTSDLSIDGWALCHQLSLRPLSQVMGSSIYQVGYQEAWGRGGWGGIGGMGGWGGMGGGGAYTVELDTLSRALNEVRSRALRRLAEEATHVGADAVVEVDTRAGESTLDTGTTTLEHTVFGTAVRRGEGPGRGGREDGHPVLTELSVADFSKLVRAGFEPLGIAAWSSVFFVAVTSELQMMKGPVGRIAFRENQELPAFTQGVYTAREAVMAELGAQASALGGTGIVGVRIGHRAVPHKLRAGGGSGEVEGLMVTFNAVGTAIHQAQEAPLYPPETTIDLTV